MAEDIKALADEYARLAGTYINFADLGNKKFLELAQEFAKGKSADEIRQETATIKQAVDNYLKEDHENIRETSETFESILKKLRPSSDVKAEKTAQADAPVKVEASLQDLRKQAAIIEAKEAAKPAIEKAIEEYGEAKQWSFLRENTKAARIDYIKSNAADIIDGITNPKEAEEAVAKLTKRNSLLKDLESVVKADYNAKRFENGNRKEAESPLDEDDKAAIVRNTEIFARKAATMNKYSLDQENKNLEKTIEQVDKEREVSQKNAETIEKIKTARAEAKPAVEKAIAEYAKTLQAHGMIKPDMVDEYIARATGAALRNITTPEEKSQTLEAIKNKNTRAVARFAEADEAKQAYGKTENSKDKDAAKAGWEKATAAIMAEMGTFKIGVYESRVVEMDQVMPKEIKGPDGKEVPAGDLAQKGGSPKR